MKSKFTYGILASILIVSGGFLFFKAKVFWSDNAFLEKSKEAKIKTQELINLAESAKYLENFYREPIDHELWGALGAQCLKRYNLQESSAFRLACSSEILECLEDYLIRSKKPFYKKNDIQINLFPAFNFKNEKKIYDVVYPFQEIAGSSSLKTHKLKLISSKGEKSEEQTLDVSLLSNCQESFLDERYYAIGSEPTDKSLEIKFDTLNKKIMIDRFQVRTGEVWDWAHKTKSMEVSEKDFKEKDSFKSFTRLPQKLMHKFCQDHGKQIMLSHLYDAATFIPFDLKNKEPQNFPRGKYYWVKKNTDAWVHQYILKPREELLNEKNCSLLFAKECRSVGDINENLLTPTWSGLYQVMGGAFEYVRNPIIAEDNLRASSKYFSLKSKHQVLGARAYWDGLNFQIKNFSFDNSEKISELEKDDFVEVAFRCYREAF